MDDLPSDALNNAQQQPSAFRLTLPNPTESEPQVNPALLSDLGKPGKGADHYERVAGQRRKGMKLEEFDRGDFWTRGWNPSNVGFPALNHPSLRSESPVHIGAASLSSSTKGLPSHINKIPQSNFSLKAWRREATAVESELNIHAIAPIDGRQSDSHMASHGENTNRPSALDPVQTTGQSEQSDTHMTSHDEDTNKPSALDLVQSTGQSEVNEDHPVPNDERQSDACMALHDEDANQPSGLDPVLITGQSEVDEDHPMDQAEEILEDGEVV